MAWIEPKTDWTSDDYFNPDDYNRIIGNIIHLKFFASTLFAQLSELTLGEEKDYTSYIYAKEINAIEDGIDALNIETYNLNIGEKINFNSNKNTPLWSEFNRIESACLLLYKTMNGHKGTLKRMAFTLGNQKGIRV